jgi:PAS domain S-box-containing protein
MREQPARRLATPAEPRAPRPTPDSYQLAFEHLSEPAFLLSGASLKVLAANAAALGTYGYRADEFLAMSYLDLLPQDARPELLRLRDLSAGGFWRGSPRVHLTKTGQEIIVEEAFRAVGSGSGRMIVALVRDVTIFQKAAEHIRRVNQNLSAHSAIGQITSRYRDPKRMLQAVLSRLIGHLKMDAGAVFLVDREGGMKLAVRRGFKGRQAGRNLEGLAARELAAAASRTGRSRCSVELLPNGPGSKKVSMACSWPLMTRRNPLGVLVLAATGERGIERQESSLVEAIAGQVAAALENALLITALHDHADKLAKAVHELKEVEKLKDGFLSGITHDLKTPLVPAVGLIRLITDEKLGPINDRQRECLDICQRNLTRQVNLIEDLIDYTRAKSGRVELDREPVDLREVVGGSIELLEVMARERGIAVECDLSPRPVPILGDRNKLARILYNFYSNAVKFNREGGLVKVRLAPSNGREAVLEVSDTGEGISPEHVERIFEHFYKVRKSPGAGIGLSVVKTFVDLHGGRVEVKSRPGKGTRFRVSLPLLSAPKDAGGGKPPKEKPPGDARKILKKVPKLRKIKPKAPAKKG